jgi:hypothetical protein
MSGLVEKYVSEADTRPTVIDWQNLLQQIISGYQERRGIIHGLQKDAIQNGWDARKVRKGTNWSFVFELVDDGNNRFLTMTDKGTTGLTGRVLSETEMQNDLSKNERWARFESLAFLKESSGTTLGARGRGKFVFVGVSKERTILYDSLREDGTYRFGLRYVKKTNSKVAAFDGDSGRNKLGEMTAGSMKPLTETGTRVMIVNPTDDLVETLKNGDFLRFLGETWWEIIQKFGARIVVRIDGKEHVSTVPIEFVLPEIDSRTHRVWFKENEKIKVAGQDFKIKRLHIISARKNPVPDDIKGVSLQRGGMKICSIEPRYLPQEIAETIYGYVTFDEDVEQLLREDEGVEHYSFNFRKSLPGAIKHFIEEEMNSFARDKLEWKVDVRAVRRQLQQSAERRALLAINRLAKDVGVATGVGTRKGVGGDRGETKVIRVQIAPLEFPRKGDFRVNYGEELKNISARAVNDSSGAKAVKFRLFLRYFDKLLKVYDETDITINPSSASDCLGPHSESLSQDVYPDKGRYTVVARLISLSEEDKGKILDERRTAFYLEEDPPSAGLFERVDPVEYEEYRSVMGEARSGEVGGFIFEYNLKHPAYDAVSDNEDDLASYLFRLMAYELCRIDLMQGESKLFKSEDKETPDSVLRKTNIVVGELMHKYYPE